MEQPIELDKWLLNLTQHELIWALAGQIQIRYRPMTVQEAHAVAADAMEETVTTMEQLGGPDVLMAVDLLDRLSDAFTDGEYLGDAKVKLLAYLKRCLAIHEANPQALTAPCFTIVQSFGYGKSRLLAKLAHDAEEHDDTMKVLYMCARPGGFPVPTLRLREWLFFSTEDVDIAHRLLVLYRHAESNWTTIGSSWLELITSARADRYVRNELRAAEGVNFTESSNSTKKQRSNKVLVLAIDEAGEVVADASDQKANDIQLLQRALVIANKTIDGGGAIFAVLADSNAKILDGPPFSFPPFVLSHTQDLHWDQLRGTLRDEEGSSITEEALRYKHVVVNGDEETTWKALISMGRPVWTSRFNASMRECARLDMTPTQARNVSRERVISLAAHKLLMGQDPSRRQSFTKETMFGIAAMLCRVGIRPSTASAVAARSVEDLMATVAYADYQNGGVLYTYPSEPVLAFGATRVWYAISTALPLGMLPQLKALQMDGVLDAGTVGEMVARIMLLLTMDSCIVVATRAALHRECVFFGQLVDVQLFLTALGGEDVGVWDSKAAKSRQERVTDFWAWRSTWEEWKMGFCQFIPLDCEPTETTLWYLLARRAAGIMPENHNGVDLVIPIFRKSKVSLIVVQVSILDSEFPVSVSDKMRPSSIFGADNPLSRKSYADIIRVSIDLHQNAPENAPTRFVLGFEDSTPSEARNAFTWCIHAPSAWSLSVGDVTHPIISEPVATQLEKLAFSMWELLQQARAQEERCALEGVNVADVRAAMPDEEVEDAASRILAPTPK